MCFSPSEESKNDVASVIPIRFFYPHLRWADCSFILSLTFCSTDVSPDSAFSYCFCIIGYLIISFRGSWWAPRKARPCNRVGTAGWTQCSGAYIDLSPPFNPGIFWGGKTRNLWEIFHLTTWNIYINIPPHMFFWLPKEVGGVLRMPHFSPEMVWYTLSFLTFGSSFHQTLERVNLPNSLQSLTFSLEFNQALERPL